MKRIYKVTVLAREKSGRKREITSAILVGPGGVLNRPADFALASLTEGLLEETRRRGLEFRGFVTTSQPAEDVG